MSATGTKGVSGLKQHYEVLLLLLVSVALLGSALYLGLRLGDMDSGHGRIQQSAPLDPDRNVTPLLETEFAARAASLNEPFQSLTRERPLMVSELRVSCIECGKPIPYNALQCPFCKAEQPAIGQKDDRDGDGMPDEWETEHGLNPLDHADAAMDNDRDGFSNLEEFHAGTRPADATDSPEAPAKLRLAGVRTVPFMLRFRGVQELQKGMIFQLNLRDERSYWAKLNEPIDEKDELLKTYRVVAYEPDYKDGESVLLQQGDKQTRLVKGKTITQDELRALLVFLIDGSQYRIKVGDVIPLKDEDYKVIDIKTDRVVIRNEKSGKDTFVRAWTDEEKAGLRGAAPTGGMPEAGGAGLR